MDSEAYLGFSGDLDLHVGFATPVNNLVGHHLCIPLDLLVLETATNCSVREITFYTSPQDPAAPGGNGRPHLRS
jgi:hypothetical protein